MSISKRSRLGSCTNWSIRSSSTNPTSPAESECKILRYTSALMWRYRPYPLKQVNKEKRSHNRRCYATTLRKKKLLYHYCAFVYALKYSSTASKLSIFLYTIDKISSVGAIRSGTIIGIIFAL